MEPFVNQDLESGAVVELFPGRRVFTQGDWYLACREEKADGQMVSTFREWLLAEIAKDPNMLKSRDQ